MKFTPEVQAALQTLKDNAENDFERHRIAVLEKDLTDPPVVEIIDEKTQKFNGLTFYANKGGHFHKDVQIHRAVYAYYYGEIPEGEYDVHHIDVNPSNNNIQNLQMLTRSEHQKIHSSFRMETPLERICANCGKNFIRKQPNSKYCSWECYVQSKHTFVSREKTCPICGNSFRTISENPTQTYCSRECANQAQTFHNRNKICPTCGKNFVAPIRKPCQVYCCRECSVKAHTAPRIERKCPVCGKSFQVNSKSRKQKVCCSKSCSQKYYWIKIKVEEQISTSPAATTSPLNHSAD